MRGSVDFLTRASWASKASAHVVIGREKEPWADQSVFPGGLVAQLPVSVVQIRLPTQRAWHSTWANEKYFGIEACSAGEVRKTNGVLCGPNGDWSEKIKDQSSIIYAAQRSWQNYTLPQIQTVVKIMQYYAAMFGSFNPSNIIGHEHAQGIKTPERPGCDKRDPGVWLDMGNIRDCAAGNIDPSSLSLQPRTCSGASVFDVASGSGSQIDAQAAEQMRQLGYYIRQPVGLRYFDGKTPENINSLQIAQRMLGLKADGIAGPYTCQALSWRMKDRWRSAPTS